METSGFAETTQFEVKQLVSREKHQLKFILIWVLTSFIYIFTLKQISTLSHMFLRQLKIDIQPLYVQTFDLECIYTYTSKEILFL